MKQTKTVKALLSALMAFALLIASPSVAFAATSSAAASSAATSSTTASETSGVTAAETSEAAIDGSINAAPNTGVEFPFPPMAAVFLALAMVPVIILASRKPAVGSREHRG